MIEPMADFSAYLEAPGISRSDIKDHLVSPRGARLRREGHPACIKGDSHSMENGRAFDAVLLARSKGDFIRSHMAGSIECPADALTKGGSISESAAAKAYLADWLADRGFTRDSVRLMAPKDIAEATAYAEHLWWLRELFYEDQAVEILELDADPQDRQVLLQWTDSETGLPCKALLDGIDRKRWIWDDKTTRRQWSDFPKDACDMKLAYHIQHVHYVDGWRTLTGDTLPFRFRCQMNAWPFDSYVCELDREAIQIAEALRRKALREIADGKSGMPDKPIVRQPSTPVYISMNAESQHGLNMSTGA